MSGRQRVKLGLAAIGAVLFLVGVRRDDAAIRWVGIGWFVAAFALRFLGRSDVAGSGTSPEAADGAPGATGG